VQAARELTQLLDRQQELALGAIERHPRSSPACAAIVGGEPQVHDECGEPLLRTVVKVAQEAPALDLGRLDQACPRRPQSPRRRPGARRRRRPGTAS
jgi:hypothetical protein